MITMGITARGPPRVRLWKKCFARINSTSTRTSFPKEHTMKILFINNDGGGFADYIDVQSGTKLEQLFEQQLPHRKPGDVLIRVNRQPVARDYVLQENDRVSMTPTKIDGARAA